MRLTLGLVSRVRWRSYAICVAVLVGCQKNTGQESVTLSPMAVTSTTAGARLLPVADADFGDLAQDAGLRYQWNAGKKGAWTILDATRGGCAFLDCDNEGWMDILRVAASGVPCSTTTIMAHSPMSAPRPGSRLKEDGRLPVLVTMITMVGAMSRKLRRPWFLRTISRRAEFSGLIPS